MRDAVIHRLRRLEGLGIVTRAHCIRAERYVERHREIFADAGNLTVSRAVDLAVELAAWPVMALR